MSRLFIRHADKGTKTADEPLLPMQEDKIYNHAKMLINKYGNPDMILTSPYLRTRETAELLNKALTEPVNIEIEPLLSEYVKQSKLYSKCTIRRDTLSHNPPLFETRDEIKKRVASVYNKYIDYPGIIWFVCHGIFISDMLCHFNYTPQRVPTLASLVISNDGIILQL